MTRRVLGSLLVVAIAFVVVARADNPIAIKVDSKKAGPNDDQKLDPKNTVEEAAIKQQRLSQQYREFEGALLRLAQRLEVSSKVEDREKAVVLKKAIEKSMNEGVDTKFDRLVTLLRTTKAVTPEMLDQAKDQNKALADDIRTILAILLTDNREDELRKERERLTKMIERLNEIIRDQKTTYAWTMRNGVSKERLGKEQNQVTRQTGDLARALGKNDGKGGEKAASKGEGKKGANKAEAKEDTNKPKAEAKNPAGVKSGQQNKNGGKTGEAKDSNKGGSKAGESKENKSGAKNGKPEEKASAIKESQKKKEQNPKKDEKADPKGRGDGKAEAKPGNQDGQSKSGQQQASQSKGQSQSGRQQQQQQGQARGDQQQQQQQNDQQQQDQLPARKKIEDANQDQQHAEQNIDKNQRKDAGKDQQNAIDKLVEAKKALEELLRQMREEEIERLLAQLQQRCERMLALQIEVRDGTLATQRAIEANGDKKPTRTEVQKGLQLADREDEIVREAGKAIDLLKTEGSAVAFPEVFIQIRSDMMNVSRRLRKTDSGSLTQTIEQDIIDTLKEMIEALKKAQKDQQARRNNPPPQQQGPPQDEKLIDLIAELKMIRSLQLRVNARTKIYAREYEGKEQAPLPESGMPPEEREKYKMVLDELKDLANRQQKIFEVTEDIAKGRNR
jgi:hypothetical protein